MQTRPLELRFATSSSDEFERGSFPKGAAADTYLAGVRRALEKDLEWSRSRNWMTAALSPSPIVSYQTGVGSPPTRT